MLVLGVVQAVGLTGCNTGRRNDGVTASTGPAIDCTDGTPFLLNVSTNEACAGATITLNGLNLPLDMADMRVTFTNSGGTISVAGQIVQVVDNGPDPNFDGCQSVSVLVTVPSGARSGLIRLEAIKPDGARVIAGNASFTACPEIVGFGVGNGATGFLAWTGANMFLNDQLQVFGYNLDGVTDVEAVDPNGTVFNGWAVAPGGVANPDYMLPPGMSVVTVTVENALVPDCESFFFELELTASQGGAPLASNRIIVPVRRAFAPDDFEDLPGVITGALVPPGVLSGLIPITYNLMADPPQSTYDVIPQFFDTDAGAWVDCDGVTASEGVNHLSGHPAMTSLVDGIPGGGATYTFMWDSSAQVTGPTALVPVRLAVQPGATSAMGVCPTAPDPNSRFELPAIVIANGGPREGAIEENFNDQVKFDEGSAQWNLTSSGQLVGGATGSLPWGMGLSAIVLEAGRDYVFNTDNGSLFDQTDMANPVELGVGQPGALEGEFHYQSLVMNEGANVTVEGDNPLIIRLSGTGNPDSLVGVFRADLNLDGENGTQGDDVPFAQGFGGLGRAGGGMGGDGGWVDVMPGPPGMVTGDIPAFDGGNNGGEGGRNVTFAVISGTSAARSGAGGGGGCVARGVDGSDTSSGTQQQAENGRGGPIRGDATLQNIVCGSGGGGGGTTTFRQLMTSDLVARTGGGAGAGGGGLLVIANGTIDISGEITANGGRGENGASAAAGPGGGGSGGTIRFSAVGDILVRDSAVIEAVGGLGDTSGGSGILTSGRGADGRIRFEAGPGRRVNFPSIGDFSQLMPPITASGISEGTAAAGTIDGGTGLDGALNLTGAPGTIYTADTDAGIITNPMGTTILTRTVDPVDFHLASLNIADEVTLVGVGSLPLILRVSGNATIDGTIDVNGDNGGTPDVGVTPPTGGLGGLGGPGSARGGDGGFVVTDTDFTHGGDGALTHLMPYGLLDPVPPYSGGGSGGDPFPPPVILAATGGETIVDTALDIAGPGGGGGYAAAGNSGMAPGAGEAGEGGSKYGSARFTLAPVSSDPLPVGGGPGGGGGGHIQSMAAPFPSAPGTGGGGGGGFVQVSVAGNLLVSADATFLAKGGDAFRAPFKGGNAGAGAGGGVFIQCDAVAEFRGAIDVRGGTANRLPSGVAYTPNTYLNAGGNGASGRVRIESPTGFVPEGALEVVPTPSIGTFLEAGAVLTDALSEPYQLTVDGGASARGEVVFDPAQVVSTIPAGSAIKILYSGAKYSLDNPGAIGEFIGLVDDPASLDDPDFIRLHFYLFNGGTAPSIDSYLLEYSYPVTP